jgi:hypothetical protein
VGVIVLRRLAYVLAAVASLAIAACSGGAGTGTGLPAPPGYNPTPSAAAAAIVREHTTGGVIYLTKDLDALKFPASTGFGFALDLGTPAPKSSAGPTAGPTSTPSPTPSLSPSPSPSSTTSGKGKAKASPSPPPGPKIETKVTVFPQDAPEPPTPEPTGNVQSFAERIPVVRGYLNSQTDLKLTSLGAAHFKLPKDERPEGRGFTIALFEEHKHRKYTLIAWEPEATLDGDTVSVEDATKPIALKKKVGYFFMLYGDDLEPTPVPKGYSPQGNNPFATAMPSVRPGYSQPYYGPPTPYYGPPTPYAQPTYSH